MRPAKFDPMAEVLFNDTQGIAGDLQEVLNAVAPFDTNTVKCVIHKKPAGPGPYALIRSYPAPINMDEIAEHLKAEFGGGDYRGTVFAGGKTRKVFDFSIIGEPKMPGAGGAKTVDPMGGDFMKFWMAMQAEQREREEAYRREQRDREDQYRRDREAREDRQAELMRTIIAAAVPALIPILAGANREKLSDLLGIINANKGSDGSLKETLEVLTIAKGLFGDGEKPAGWNPDDIVGSLGRLAGPVAEAAGRAFRGRGAPPAEVEAPEEYLSLPEPDAPAGGQPPAPLAAPAAVEPASRVVALVRPHVLYYYSSDLPPDLAAEAIIVILQREGITDGEVTELATAFALSADWKADLAAQGIDLRGNPDWADDFLSELVGQWSETAGNVDDSARDGGGRGDLAGDAPASPSGGAKPKRKGSGATGDGGAPA